jgi:hypothetical protein
MTAPDITQIEKEVSQNPEAGGFGKPASESVQYNGHSEASTVPNEDPDGLADLLDRPALDDPGITIRPDGRQLVISRGGHADPDEGESDAEDRDEDSSGQTDPAKRGEITEFSEGSRRRVRSLLHSLRRSSDLKMLFATLTYHETRPDPTRAKRDLDAFSKRLRRAFPGLSVIWKMEPQKRGVPHFHLIVIGARFIPVQWLSELWHDVTAETSDEHRKSGVDLEPVWGNEDGKLQAYLSEYLSEESEGAWPEAGGEDWRTPGRFWGVLGRKNLPVAPWADWSVHLDHADAARLIGDLLDEWDTDLPDGVLPPSLIINCRGDPEKTMDALLDRL